MSKLLLGAVTLTLACCQVRADAPAWGQCGGLGWNGETTCVSGYVCTYVNIDYSQCLPGTPNPEPYPPGTGLNGRFVAAGKVCWGAPANLSTFNTAAAVTILKSDFGCLTPLSAWTWDITEPTPGYFTFVNGDAIFGWAIANGKRIWASTLLWHSHNPSWVNSIHDRNSLTSAIQNHVTRLVERYSGKIYAWDVVSEMFNEDGSVRTSVFSTAFGGDGFVNVAFQAARAADPTAKLYITEYNINSVNAKLNGLVNLVKKVNSGGTKLIDGCGIRAQLGSAGASGLQAAITALGAAGCAVSIVDLEIAGSSTTNYLAVVRACLNSPYCVSISSAGVNDSNASNGGLLFDVNYKPKAAYTAIMNALPTPTSIPSASG